MKSSNSGILTNLNSNYFFTGLGINEYSSIFNQSNEKANVLQFELDRNRDTIMKLRTELLNKNKEISMLKVQKNKKEDEHQRVLRTLEEIMKQSDQSTGAGFKALESYLRSKNTNTILNKDETKNNNKEEERLDEIKDMIHLNEEQKNTLKDIVYINTLKNQINALKEDLDKKEKEINQIKKNKNNSSYIKLQNNFVKNFNELTQIKKQNEVIKKKMEEATSMLMAKKTDNINLKNKLQEFQKKFKYYKEESIKKTESLEKNLNQAKEKERNCRIFHIKKNAIYSNTALNNNSNFIDNSKSLFSNEENSKSNLNENDIKLNEAEQEMKKLTSNLNELKKESNSKNNEIKKLKMEKKELNNQIKLLSNENNKYLNQLNNLNKQIQDMKNKNTNIEKENNDIKQKIEDIDSRYEKEKLNYGGLKEILNEKEKEINDLKQIIEDLKNKNKDDLFFTGIGAIGKKKDEIIETDNIADELAQIEKKFAKANQEHFDSEMSLNNYNK
jgi:chromosome segregation ATPase